MKRILLALLLIGGTAHAQTVENDLVGLGMKPEIANYIAGILPAGSVLGNNTFLKGRDQANSADISVLKVDTTDDTVLNADTGDVIKLSVASTPFAQANASAFSMKNDSWFASHDAQGTPAANSLVKSDSSNNTHLNVVSGGVINFSIAGTPAIAFSASSNLYPVTTGNYNLGTSANRWGKLFINTNGNNAGGINIAPFVATTAATPVAGTNQVYPGWNIVPTAAANDAVCLKSTPVAGDQYEIYNSNSANAVRVKACGAATLNGATAGGYVVLAARTSLSCLTDNSAANHSCVLGPNPTPAGP